MRRNSILRTPITLKRALPLRMRRNSSSTPPPEQIPTRRPTFPLRRRARRLEQAEPLRLSRRHRILFRPGFTCRRPRLLPEAAAMEFADPHPNRFTREPVWLVFLRRLRKNCLQFFNLASTATHCKSSCRRWRQLIPRRRNAAPRRYRHWSPPPRNGRDNHV